MRGEGIAGLVKIAAGGDGGRAADLGFPEAISDGVDDALRGLEGSGDGEERGGLGEDAVLSRRTGMKRFDVRGLSALVLKYGDVFSGRIECHSPFHPSRRRENTAPPQDERIRSVFMKRNYLLDKPTLPRYIRGRRRDTP